MTQYEDGKTIRTIFYDEYGEEEMVETVEQYFLESLGCYDGTMIYMHHDFQRGCCVRCHLLLQ